MDWLLAALEMGTQVLACQATTIECSLDCFQTGTIISPGNELINSYLLLVTQKLCRLLKSNKSSILNAGLIKVQQLECLIVVCNCNLFFSNFKSTFGTFGTFFYPFKLCSTTYILLPMVFHIINVI